MIPRPLLLTSLILGAALPMTAGTFVGRATASATARVSIAIPKLTGMDVTAAARPLVSTGAAHVDLRVFETGNGALLIRTAARAPSTIVRAAFREEDESRVIASGAPGWQQIHDTPPAGSALRSSTDHGEQEITYELWQF